MNSIKAVIFMTTYNGEDYICEQLDSILGQTFSNWSLIVSDDGSTDRTIDILRRYEALDSRITFIQNSGLHGAYSNYYNLFSYYKDAYGSQADYYFFCDQDDIWITEKLEMQINVLSELEAKYGKSYPLLCYSDLELVTTSGVPLHKCMSDLVNIDLRSNPLNLFFAHCYVWGTTAAINKSLWKFAELPSIGQNDLSHDNWFAKHAVLAGRAELIAKPLVKYRRHNANVSDLPAHGLRGVFRRALSFRSVVNDQSHVYWSSLQVLESIDFVDERCIELKKTFEEGGWYAARFMFNNKICPGGSVLKQVARYIDLGLRLHKRTKWFKG